MRFLFCFLLFTAFAGAGCNIVNPADPVPTFVLVDSFTFENAAPDATVGSTRKLRSVFVSFQGRNVGTFDLPARIPVITEEGGVLSLFPGVDNTAQFVTQLQYPHYRIAEVPLGPSNGSSVRVTPQTGYVPASKFVYKENFENSNDIAVLFGPNFEVTTLPAEVISGSRSGILRLDDSSRDATLTTTSGFVPGPTDNFLEIDYRSTGYLQVGAVAGTSSPAFAVTLIPAPAGNKVYISLQSVIAAFGANPGAFRLVFQFYKETGAENASLIMDNLKVVTF